MGSRSGGDIRAWSPARFAGQCRKFVSEHENRVKLAQTFGYCILGLTTGLLSSSLGPNLSELAQRTSSTTAQLSILFTAKGLGALTGALTGGLFVDKFPPHFVLAGAQLVMGVATVSVPFVTDRYALATVYVILGLGFGCIGTAGHTSIVWLWTLKRQGAVMQVYHFFFGLGSQLAPLLNGMGSLAATYGSMSIMCGIGMIVSALTPSPPSLVGREHEVGVSKAAKNGRREYILVFLIALFMFLYVGGELMFAGYLATFVRVMGLMDQRNAEYITSAFWGAITIGRVLSGPLFLCLSLSSVMISSLVLCLATLALMLAVAHSAAMVWAGVALLGLCIGPVYPGAISLPTPYGVIVSGKVTTWLVVGTHLGEMTVPLVMSLAFNVGESVRLLWALLAMLALALVCFIVGHVYNKKTRRTAVPAAVNEDGHQLLAAGDDRISSSLSALGDDMSHSTESSGRANGGRALAALRTEPPQGAEGARTEKPVRSPAAADATNGGELPVARSPLGRTSASSSVEDIR